MIKKFKSMRILAEDHKKIQKWAIDRELHDYEIITFLVNKK